MAMKEKYGSSEVADAGMHLPSAPRQAAVRNPAGEPIYRQALEHYEMTWGGYLPATPPNIVNYLVRFAGELATSTLKMHLAALSRWHVEQGFPDPTKDIRVQEVFNGIRREHPDARKQATPVQLDQLELVHSRLAMNARLAEKAADWAEVMRCRRDIAMLLIGFWRGFSGDELSRLLVEHIQYEPGVAMRVYLPRRRPGYRYAEKTFSLPALNRLCPVQAYVDWLEVADLTHGPVFQAITCWGELGELGLSRNSMIRILKSALKTSALPASRGLTHWVYSNGWNLRTLMNYVGWLDEQKALPYLDQATTFGGFADNPSWVTVMPLPK